MQNEIDSKKQELLRRLPKVDRMLDIIHASDEKPEVPRRVVTGCIRNVVDDLRNEILLDASGVDKEDVSEPVVSGLVRQCIRRAMRHKLVRTVNATGVVVHTNLGRSLLSARAAETVTEIATHYSNLEYNLAEGKRGSRYQAVEDIICEISGAEAALAVNNNAGAVLLCLDTVARGTSVIVSRGELVEIGGSFRVPDVMAKSGCTLKGVGTTNRTHLKDYEGAITNETGMLLKVHTSNYAVVGFTKAVSLAELVELGGRYHIPVMEDLGSGTFIDFANYGMLREPTVQESVAAGVDLVTFSGDKLLGGPQAGIILGKKEMIDRIKTNPLTRALRLDKMTLAALESTMRLYRDEAGAIETIPTLRMLMSSYEEIGIRAGEMADRLAAVGNSRLSVSLLDRASKTGGGSLPLLDLPSRCVVVEIEGMSADTVEKRMRAHEPPIIGRIDGDRFIMDMRTVQPEDQEVIEQAVVQLLEKDEP